MLIIDLPMPECCMECKFYEHDFERCVLYSENDVERMHFDETVKQDWCELAEIDPETNIAIYDQEEIVENCTVQIWSNSVTGDVSIGWWRNAEVDE